MNTAMPAIWLLIVIVGLPQLSETVYTPALPDIARALSASDSWVEYTLTIYLLGFAVGTLFWGKLSDRFGRKPCLLLGLLIYVLGCIGCYFSPSIEWLLFSRFVQAFGGSTGSVLGQAICRDAFHGPALGKAYATVGSALAFSPAIGPVIGGIIDEAFGWQAIFLALIVIGLMVCIAVYASLPETHPHASKSTVSVKDTAIKLLKDRTVLAYGILVAGGNGIMFSYYAEGSFYLIELLGLSPAIYGASFLTIASTGILGSWLSRKMLNRLPAETILMRGIWLILLGCFFFSVFTMAFSLISASKLASILLTLGSMMLTTVGIGMTLPNALSLALQNHRQAIGTASSLFGFFYYMLISALTLGMGSLHNGTLFPMPLYFCGIAMLMWAVSRMWIDFNKRMP